MKLAIGCMLLLTGCVADYYPPTIDSGPDSDLDPIMATDASFQAKDSMVVQTDAMGSVEAGTDSKEEAYCALLWGNTWQHFYCSQNPWVWYDSQAKQHTCSEACPINSTCIMNGNQGYCNK